MPPYSSFLQLWLCFLFPSPMQTRKDQPTLQEAQANAPLQQRRQKFKRKQAMSPPSKSSQQRSRAGGRASTATSRETLLWQTQAATRCTTVFKPPQEARFML